MIKREIAELKTLKKKVTLTERDNKGTIIGKGIRIEYTRAIERNEDSENSLITLVKNLFDIEKMVENAENIKSELKNQIADGLKKEVLEAAGVKETVVKAEKVIEKVKDYKLKAKTVYESAGYFYKTDAKGRIAEVKGKLRIDKAERAAYHQRMAGGTDRLDTDDGGHLIAARFGGSKKIDNLVAMDSKINRHEDYRGLEDIWEKEMSKVPPNEVFAKITPIYKGDSKRPAAFNIEYEVYDSHDKLFKSEKIFIKNS